MFMKTRLILFVIALCGAFATTAAFGQATGNAVQTNFVWIAAGSNLDVGTSTNWSPTGVPNPARTGSSSDYGDIMDFNGQTTGPVFATSNGGSQVGGSVGGATAGLYVHVTSNQANRVTLYTTIASGASSGARFNSMTFDAGSGGFTMGTGSTTNCLDTLWGTSNPETQGLTNNSANPAIINLDVRWRLGAGGVHTFVFSGTGDWYITNDIANGNRCYQRWFGHHVLDGGKEQLLGHRNHDRHVEHLGRHARLPEQRPVTEQHHHHYVFQRRAVRV
jgi:hypothetical protein